MIVHALALDRIECHGECGPFAESRLPLLKNVGRIYNMDEALNLKFSLPPDTACSVDSPYLLPILCGRLQTAPIISTGERDEILRGDSSAKRTPLFWTSVQACFYLPESW